MIPIWQRRAAALLIAAMLIITADRACACAVPVFRYALERWLPDPYDAIVFHRGPLAKDDAAAVASLRERAASRQAPANVAVRTVDLAAGPPADLAALFLSLGTKELPCIALRYPAGAAFNGAVWCGRLSRETVQTVADSPLRRELARRLMGGDSAVWVLLESGNAAKDNAAAAILTARLGKLQQTMKLPEMDGPSESPDAESGVQSSVPLKIAFSLLRIPRRNTAEEILRGMLIHSENDLLNYPDEPIAFPVYGRGRILYSLVGKGICPENIREACDFLVGSCSCQAKMDNPGTDLLISANWAGAIDHELAVDKALPPLTGVMPLPPDGKTTGAAQAPITSSPRAFLVRVAAAIAIAVVAAAIGTAILLVRRSRARRRQR